MDYYRLKNASGTKETGNVYPQIQTMGGTFYKDAPDSIYKVPSGKFPDFTPNLDCFILEPKAKLTDFVSAVQISNGFIISDKVKNILEKFNIVEHRFFPATIKTKDTIYENYYWFCPVSDLVNLIDFKKTDFFKTDFFGDKEDKILKFNSLEHFHSFKKELSKMEKISSSKIHFKNQISQYSLFKIRSINHNIYIDESLAREFNKHNISGFSLSKSKIIQAP